MFIFFNLKNGSFIELLLLKFKLLVKTMFLFIVVPPSYHRYSNNGPPAHWYSNEPADIFISESFGMSSG